jgi:hypothetical protein
MKLPRLSPDEMGALQIDSRDAAANPAERIRTHLRAGLPAQVRVEAGVLALPVSVMEGESPHLRADDDLLAAWVAARFGSVDVCKPVPARYGTSLLMRVRQALAELALRGQLDEAASMHLEIRLNDQRGRLELDWSDMNAKALRAWARKQWESEDG